MYSNKNKNLTKWRELKKIPIQIRTIVFTPQAWSWTFRRLTMSRKARLSQTSFNPHAGVDLDAVAERCDEQGSGADFEELTFDEPRESRTPRKRTGIVAQF
jgi:hypothetical protein